METSPKSDVLRELARNIAAIGRPARAAGLPVVHTGWEAVDASLPAGGLALGGVHEFLAATDHAAAGEGLAWCVMAHLARQAAEQIPGQVIWISRACWPNPAMLERMGLLDRSLMVDGPDVAQRLWAMDLCLSSPAAACVIGDGGGMPLAATRRLELSAQAARCLVLLGRPSGQRPAPSACSTRWSVAASPAESLRPAWQLELVGFKGARPGHHGPWTLEWDHAKGAVVIPALLADRLPAAAASPRRRRSAV